MLSIGQTTHKPMSFHAASAPVLQLLGFDTPLPTNLGNVLSDLGAGDNRFGGTSFGRSECDLPTFLQECRNTRNGLNLPADKVPQSTYCLVAHDGRAVGLVRVRHRLNAVLFQYGGHIGYYVHPSERGKGYGRSALELGLEKLRQLNVDRALLTVNPANTLSKRVVLANGGSQDGQGVDPVSGEIVDRYWIQL